MMTLEAQKLELIEKITKINNQEIIDQLNAILQQEAADFYDNLTEAQKASALKGFEQIKEGKTVPHKEVKKIYKKWL